VRRDVSLLARRFGDQADRVDRLVEMLAGRHTLRDYALLNAAVRLARGIYLDWRRPAEVIGLADLLGVYRLVSMLPPAQRTIDGLRALARELRGLGPNAPVGAALLRELAGAAAAVIGPVTPDALRALLVGAALIPPGIPAAVRANIAHLTGGAYDQESLDRLGTAIGLPLDASAGGHVAVGRLAAVVAATRRAHLPDGQGNVRVLQVAAVVKLTELAGGARWPDLVGLAQQVYDTLDDLDAAAVRALAGAAAKIEGPLTVARLQQQRGIVPADPLPGADPGARNILEGLVGVPLTNVRLVRLARDIGLAQRPDGTYELARLDGLARLGRQLFGAGLTVEQLGDLRATVDLVIAAATGAQQDRLRRDPRVEDLVDFAAATRHDLVTAQPDHAARALINTLADHIAAGGAATVDAVRTAVRVSEAAQAEAEYNALTAGLAAVLAVLSPARRNALQNRLQALDAQLDEAIATAETPGQDLAGHLRALRRLNEVTELIADLVRAAYAVAGAELPEAVAELAVNDPRLVAENLARLVYPQGIEGNATHNDLRWLGRDVGLPGPIAGMDPRATTNLVMITRELFVETTATPAGRATMVTSRQVRRVRMLLDAAGLDPATATLADLLRFAERIDAVVDPARAGVRPEQAAVVQLRELAGRAQVLADGGARVSMANLVFEEVRNRHRAQWNQVEAIVTGLRPMPAARSIAGPLVAAADELTGEIGEIAAAVSGGAAVAGPLAARIAALPARFAALVAQAHAAVLADVRRINEQAGVDGLDPARLDAFLTAAARQLRRGAVTVAQVRARLRHQLATAALDRFGPGGALGRQFAAEAAVSAGAGGPGRVLPLNPLRTLQATAERANTDHEAWLRRLRAAIGAARAQLDRVRADLVALAAEAKASDFDLPRGTAFGPSHAIAWLELNRLATVQGTGLVGLGRLVGVGNQDTVKGLSAAQRARYVRRLRNIARLAVELTGGVPLTVPLLESVRRLTDAIRRSDPAVGDNVTQDDVDLVIRWLTGAPRDYVPTRAEREELLRLADRAKGRAGHAAVGLPDIQAQWQAETAAARRQAGEILTEVTANRGVLDVVVAALDGDARATSVARRDELARELARQLDREWLTADPARLAALQELRTRSRQLVTAAGAALRQLAADRVGEVAALLDELAARGGDAAALRGRLAGLRARFGPLAGVLTAATARPLIEALSGLAALRAEAAAAVAATAPPAPPAATDAAAYPPDVYGDGFGAYLDLVGRIYPTLPGRRRLAVATLLAAVDNRGRLRELAADPQHEIARLIARGLGPLRRFTGVVHVDAALTAEQLAAYARGNRVRPGVQFGTAGRRAELATGVTARIEVIGGRGRDAGVLLSRPGAGRDAIVLDPDVEYEVIDNRLDEVTGTRHIRLREAQPVPAPPPLPPLPGDALRDAYRAARERGDRKIDPYPGGGPGPLPKVLEDDEKPPGFSAEIEFTFGPEIELVKSEDDVADEPYREQPALVVPEEEDEEDEEYPEGYERYETESEDEDRENLIARAIQNIVAELYETHELLSIAETAPIGRVRENPARYQSDDKFLLAADEYGDRGVLISYPLIGLLQEWLKVGAGLEALTRHHAIVDETTGGHIRLGVGQLNGQIGAFARLLKLFKATEDVVYRLSNDPTGTHQRSLESAWPNPIPASGYASITTLNELQRLQLEPYYGVNFRDVIGEVGDSVQIRTSSGSLNLAVWQIRVALFRAMVLAAVDPALDARLDELLEHGEPLGANHAAEQESGYDENRDVAALHRLVDLLQLTADERIRVAQLFAATSWLPAPAERPTWLPRRGDPWNELEAELFPELTEQAPIVHATRIPTAAERRAVLAEIRAALSLDAEPPPGRLAELWGRLHGALGQTAVDEPGLWLESVRRDRSILGLPAVLEFAQQLVNEIGRGADAPNQRVYPDADRERARYGLRPSPPDSPPPTDSEEGRSDTTSLGLSPSPATRDTPSPIFSSGTIGTASSLGTGITSRAPSAASHRSIASSGAYSDRPTFIEPDEQDPQIAAALAAAAAAAAHAAAVAAAEAEFADLVDAAAHVAALWQAMERAESTGATDSAAYRAAGRAAAAILRHHPILHLIAAHLRADDPSLSRSAALAAFVRAKNQHELADAALGRSSEYALATVRLLQAGEVHPLDLTAFAAAAVDQVARSPFESLLARSLLELGNPARAVAAIEASEQVAEELKTGLIQAITGDPAPGGDPRRAHRDALAATGQLLPVLDETAAAYLAELRRVAGVADLRRAYDQALEALERGQQPVPPLSGAPSVHGAIGAALTEASTEQFLGHVVPYVVLLMLVKAKEDTLLRLADDGRGDDPLALPNPMPAQGYESITDFLQLRALATGLNALDLTRTDGPPAGHRALFRLLLRFRPDGVWQGWDSLSRAMVRASVDPTVAARLIELLARGELLGRHRAEEDAGEGDLTTDLAALYELLELLPLDRAARCHLARLFAVGRWQQGPPLQAAGEPRPWEELEPKLFPELVVEEDDLDTLPPVRIPAIWDQDVQLNRIRAALAEEDLIEGMLTELWGGLEGAMRVAAVHERRLWSASLRREPAVLRLPQVRHVARALVNAVGREAYEIAGRPAALGSAETRRYGLNATTRSPAQDAAVRQVQEAARVLAQVRAAMSRAEGRPGGTNTVEYRRAAQAETTIVGHYPVLRTVPAVIRLTHPNRIDAEALLAFADEGDLLVTLPVLTQAVEVLSELADFARALLDSGEIHPLELPAAVWAALDRQGRGHFTTTILEFLAGSAVPPGQGGRQQLSDPSGGGRPAGRGDPPQRPADPQRCHRAGLRAGGDRGCRHRRGAGQSGRRPGRGVSRSARGDRARREPDRVRPPRRLLGTGHQAGG
jgi:hypothetical protein